MSDFNKDLNRQPDTRALSVLGKQYQVPLNTLFTQVFGLAGQFIRHYKIPKDEQDATALNYQIDTNDQEVTEDNVKSALGTPVLFWMKFGAGGYLKRVNGNLKKIDLRELMLPYSTIATFSRATRKTVTYMSGGNGAIVEEYGKESWNIRLQGFIINGENGKTIEQQVKDLEQFERLSDAVDVQGKLFQWLEIDAISFDDIEWLPRRELNLESILPFEIKCMSDEVIELVNPES